MRYREIMTEAVIRLEMRYGVLPVLKNPTHRQISNAFMKHGILRGTVDGDGNLYVWDAADSTHMDVEGELGLVVAHRFMMRGNGTVETENHDVDEIANSPALKRAYGGDFNVERDNAWDDDDDELTEGEARETGGAGGQPLPATPENIAAAKRFVFGKWQERAKELGRDDPIDLTDACKFTSLFAAMVFGGTMRGNFFHQWIELPDGRTLDLNDEAADVITMLRGEIPDASKDYAIMMRKKLPRSLYTHDERHMRRRDNRQSVASVRPRVERWVDEFLRVQTLTESATTPTVRDLIRRYGGLVIEFRNLPATAQRAIRTRGAEHLDPDDNPRIDPRMRFGYVEIPMEALQQAVLAAVQREGAPFQTFDEYHRWYIGHGDTPMHTEVWPIELDVDDPDQIIDDGSHRFHSYVRSGVKVVPAIYRLGK